jgi:cell division protein ZapB
MGDLKMSMELLQKLEEKIDSAIDTVELLRLQNEELEEKYSRLQSENNSLKEKQATWEKNLSLMLEKLDAIEASESSYKSEVVPA